MEKFKPMTIDEAREHYSKELKKILQENDNGIKYIIDCAYCEGYNRVLDAALSVLPCEEYCKIIDKLNEKLS